MPYHRSIDSTERLRVYHRGTPLVFTARTSHLELLDRYRHRIHDGQIVAEALARGATEAGHPCSADDPPSIMPALRRVAEDRGCSAASLGRDWLDAWFVRAAEERR